MLTSQMIHYSAGKIPCPIKSQYTNQTWHNATKYLETKIWYIVKGLGIKHNKIKTSQRLPVDLQALGG
jgi:hypothetical protein